MSGKHFSVWPILIDMVTSVLIIIILYFLLEKILNREQLELIVINKKKEVFEAAFINKFNQEVKVDSSILISKGIDHVQITFRDTLIFRSASYFMEEKALKTIKACAQQIKSSGDSIGLRLIRIEGHTDSDPFKGKIDCRLRSTNEDCDDLLKDNWDLSSLRALGILKQFVKCQIDSTILSSSGYSSQKPLTQDSSARGKAQNRRVDIKIYFTRFSDQIEP
ncbi:MAG: OmpA family protein [Roseivirga sp.]|nr:OmpA family protein [Roseivirga sp.]